MDQIKDSIWRRPKCYYKDKKMGKIDPNELLYILTMIFYLKKLGQKRENIINITSLLFKATASKTMVYWIFGSQSDNDQNLQLKI